MELQTAKKVTLSTRYQVSYNLVNRVAVECGDIARWPHAASELATHSVTVGSLWETRLNETGRDRAACVKDMWGYVSPRSAACRNAAVGPQILLLKYYSSTLIGAVYSKIVRVVHDMTRAKSLVVV